jgi:predicted aconitase with swiveling domain
MGMMTTLFATSIVAGDAAATALASSEPLSFWGGYDPDSGEIIDRHHPLSGMVATGRVLVIPSGRGSCSGSGTLLEAIHNGNAPAAIVLGTIDPIIALGAILGEELYGIRLPVVVLSELERCQIKTGDIVTLAADGMMTILAGVDS